MTPDRLPALLRFLCPHADERVAAGLMRAGLYRKLLNYFWVEFLMARGSASLLGGKPYWLTIDPNNFCQLHCPFCPTGAERGVRAKAMMDLPHFKEIMRRLGPAAIHLDMMNWGESLLNRELPEMIACAKSHSIEVRLDANLNTVSEGTIERLILSGLDVLSLSIDGASPETYGRYRRGGDFDRVMGHMRSLVRKRAELGRKNPWIVWQFLVFRHNEHERARAAELARDLGVDQVSFVAPFIPPEPAYLWEWMALDPGFQRYAPPRSEPSGEALAAARGGAYARKTSSSEAYYSRRFGAASLFSLRYLRHLLGHSRGPREAAYGLSRFRKAAGAYAASRRGGDSTPFTRLSAGERRICKWPWAGIAVNPNGSVSPCCSVEEESEDFGNVFQKGFAAIWGGSKYKGSRRHVRRYLRGSVGVLPDSAHVCERCTAIGVSNFIFPNHSPYGSDPHVSLSRPQESMESVA